MIKKHITISGTMWDLIALQTMGSELYKDKLMQANIKYRDIYIFPAGIELVIPEITIKTPSSMPPWKRGSGA